MDVRHTSTLVPAFLFYFLTLIHIMPVTKSHRIEHDHADEQP